MALGNRNDVVYGVDPKSDLGPPGRGRTILSGILWKGKVNSTGVLIKTGRGMSCPWASMRWHLIPSVLPGRPPPPTRARSLALSVFVCTYTGCPEATTLPSQQHGAERGPPLPSPAASMASPAHIAQGRAWHLAHLEDLGVRGLLGAGGVIARRVRAARAPLEQQQAQGQPHHSAPNARCMRDTGRRCGVFLAA
jgi:hypothetical protein